MNQDLPVSPTSLYLDDKIIFDIDPVKESLEHISSDNKGDAKKEQEPRDDLAIIEVPLNSDDEDNSSISYRAVPTSASLERASISSSSSSSSGSSGSSVSFTEDIIEDEKKGNAQKKKVFLPAMETVIRNLGIIQQRSATNNIKKTAESKQAGAAVTKQQQKQENDGVNYTMEIVVDVDMYSSSILNPNINIKDIPINNLGPREQEEAGNKLQNIKNNET
jgi:hypothetical protein